MNNAWVILPPLAIIFSAWCVSGESTRVAFQARNRAWLCWLDASSSCLVLHRQSQETLSWRMDPSRTSLSVMRIANRSSKHKQDAMLTTRERYVSSLSYILKRRLSTFTSFDKLIRTNEQAIVLDGEWEKADPRTSLLLSLPCSVSACSMCLDAREKGGKRNDDISKNRHYIIFIYINVYIYTYIHIYTFIHPFIQTSWCVDI